MAHTLPASEGAQNGRVHLEVNHTIRSLVGRLMLQVPCQAVCLQ